MGQQGFPGDKGDIEEQIKDWVQNLKKKVGADGPGKGNGGGPPSMPSFDTGKLILPALGLLIIIAAYSSFYKVELSEEAVVTRFGKYVDTVGPGPHFKLPFGVDKHFIVASKVTLQEQFGFRSEEARRYSGSSSAGKRQDSKESLMLTGDLNVADVEWAIQYRIADPWKYLFHARDVTRNIRDVSMSIMRRVVGDRLAGEVLTVARVAIAAEAKVLTQEVLDQYDMGINIEQVILQDVNPPEPVKPAFNEVNAAKQEQEQAINNAEREYNKIIPEARGKAEQVIANARAYEIEMVNRAKGDASQFTNVLKEYKLAPKVTKERLYIETMEEIFSQMAKLTIVDQNVKGLLPIYSQTPTANLPQEVKK